MRCTTPAMLQPTGVMSKREHPHTHLWVDVQGDARCSAWLAKGTRARGTHARAHRHTHKRDSQGRGGRGAHISFPYQPHDLMACLWAALGPVLTSWLTTVRPSVSIPKRHMESSGASSFLLTRSSRRVAAWEMSRLALRQPPCNP